MMIGSVNNPLILFSLLMQSCINVGSHVNEVETDLNIRQIM